MDSADYKKIAAAVFITGGLLGTGYAIGRYGRGEGKGYHPYGPGRGKCGRQYYNPYIKKLRRRLDEAYQQMQQGQFRYAVYDTRTVMEEALKLLIRHINGAEDIDRSLLTKLKICERRQLLGKDKKFIRRLHEVFHICNISGNDFGAEEALNHKEVYFAIMQTKDLLNFVESTLVSQNL